MPLSATRFVARTGFRKPNVYLPLRFDTFFQRNTFESYRNDLQMLLSSTRNIVLTSPEFKTLFIFSLRVTHAFVYAALRRE